MATVGPVSECPEGTFFHWPNHLERIRARHYIAGEEYAAIIVHRHGHPNAHIL